MRVDKTQNQTEVERLAKVYRGYKEEDAERSRWTVDNPGNQLALSSRRKLFKTLLEKHGFFPLENRLILDIGCGNGKELAYFTQWGAAYQHLYGIDLLSERVEEARRSFPQIDFQVGNAEQLNFDDASFDLITLYTVLSSVLDNQMAQNLSREVRRVLKSGGAVVWYDFRYNNPRNPNVRGMTKKAIRELFPEFELHLQSTTLLPPLARRLGHATATLYPVLSTVPFLRTHYFGLLLKL